MKLTRLPVLVFVVAMIAAACGDSGTTTTAPGTGGTGDVTTTTAAPPDTTLPPATTAPPATTQPPTTGDTMAPLNFDAGFDPDTGTIKLGVLAATTGPISGIGQSVFDGHRVFWDRVNANGGINGQYPVELVVRDNAYNPEQNVVVYNEIKDEVALFSSTLGTPTTATIFEDAAANDLLVNAGSLASQWALTSNVILNLGANSYFAQFANAPYWAMEIADPPVITGDSVVGIIYQADDYGQDCKNGYDFAQQNQGFTAGFEATYAATDSEFSAQIGGAQAAGVDVLFVCALPTALATMLGTAAAIQYSPAVFGSSPSYNVALPAALGAGDEAAGVALFNSFPFYNLGTSAPWESDFPGLVQMREDLATYGPDVPPENVNAFFFFGYTQGQTVEAILETAFSNGDITKVGILAAIDQTTDVDLGVGGGAAGYGPTPKDRITTNEDSIGIVTTLSERVFGIEPISDFFEAPYLADWDPAG